MGYTFLTRDEWGAEYDVSQRALMKYLPVSEVFAHHTVTVPSADPTADMREIERIDMNRFGVPSYSWVYHPLNRVWMEGMGLHRGAHTINNGNYSYNDEAFGLSVIGNFNDDSFSDENVEDYASFISGLWYLGFAKGDLNLRGHRDVYATACNGANFYARLPEIYEHAIYLINTPATTPAPPSPPVQTEEFTVGQYEDIMMSIQDLKASLPKTPIIFMKELKSVMRDGNGNPINYEFYTDRSDIRALAVYISRDNGATMTWLKDETVAFDWERFYKSMPSVYMVIGSVVDPIGISHDDLPVLVGEAPHF